MNFWEWESFCAILESPGFHVVDPGPLEAPVSNFTLTRDANRSLVLETVAAGDTSNKAIEYPAGTVRQPTEKVVFRSDFGSTAVATGVSPRKRTESRHANGQRECREVSQVQRVEITAKDPKPTAFIIDWLENLDRDGHWMGEMIRTRSRTPHTRTVGSGPTALVFRGRGTDKDEASHAALELEIGGIGLFVCAELHIPERIRPGFIIYRGAPAEEVRRRIRNVVSFCLGCGLVHLGSTELDERSGLVRTTALAGNPFGDRIFDVAQGPPAPLGKRFRNEVDQTVLSRMAAAIYDHYEELNFDALSWAYWHAVCAPVHMAAAHFGAAIEGLQAAYREAHLNDARSKIITDKAKARAVRSAINEALDQIALDPEARNALDDKIAQLNSATGAAVSKRIMSELGLELGTDEQAAWHRRNNAAHGKPPAEGDIIPLIRDTKLLRLILNRMVLKIADASPTYIDDYTVGHAVRPLEQPVPSVNDAMAP